MRMKGSN